MIPPSERDPVARVVDAETFSLFLAGYKTEIFNRYQRVNPKGQRSIVLANRPWNMIPARIQDVLQKQYAVAKREGEKKVDINFRPDSLVFQIKSPDINGIFDPKGGEVAIPLVMLLSHNHRTGRRGEWMFTSMPEKDLPRYMELSKKMGTKLLSPPEMTEIINFFHNVNTLPEPVKIDEYQDMARFLLQHKNDALVKSTLTG
jgi:hypothetical protein